jgi:molecular chaperone GrpE (heat shock protein)
MYTSNAVGIALLLTASATISISAFSTTVNSRNTHHVTSSSSTSAWRSQPSSLITLSMSEADEADTTVATDEASTEEEVEKQEDPAVTKLKEQIASLESDLKRKKADLQNFKEMTEKYSNVGYARQVALVENNKRNRKSNMADSKGAARASAIQTFLPVLHQLEVVKARYEGNEFGKTLGALGSEFENALGELGVTQFGVEVGDKVDGSSGRVVMVGEEHSEEFAAGTVISVLRSGLEISGNVVRPAECVGSLGPESVGGEDEGAAAEGEEGAAAEGEEGAME